MQTTILILFHKLTFFFGFQHCLSSIIVLSTRPNTYKHNVTVLVAIPIEMNDYNFQQHIQDATELIIAQIKSQMTQISV